MWKEAFQKNPKLALALIPLIAGVVLLQSRIDPLRSQPAIEPPSIKNVLTGTKGGQLPGEFILGAFSGFRQVIAGLLWVRCDSFFHQGNYDAILPLIRMITWLDPNWMDVYATGGWHLMYNFTDTDQRSDRRYLVPGLSLLNEGIANNPNVYDMYKEKGWNCFDKVKDFSEAAIAYRGALANDPKANTTQVMHALAHSLERSGDIDEAIAVWGQAREAHLKEAASSKDNSQTDSQGAQSAGKNLSLLKIRKAVRPANMQQPIDTQVRVKVKRLASRQIEISGTINIFGTLGNPYFDAGTFDKTGTEIATIGKGVIADGPRDGARMEFRLEDEGYKMILPTNFDLQVDPSVTIMQDQASIKGGRRVRKGEPYTVLQKNQNMADQRITDSGVYGFSEAQAATLGGIPAAQAVASGAITALAKRMLVNLSYPRAYGKPGVYSEAEVNQFFVQLRSDSLKLGDLGKQNIFIAQKDLLVPGNFTRKIDMTQDPQMYGFVKDKYELVLWFNPRTAPDFVQDRMGWNGEGITDKKYLVETTEPYPWIEHKGAALKPVRMIRVTIKLTKEQLTAPGEAILFEG